MSRLLDQNGDAIPPRVQWTIVVQIVAWVVAALLTYGAINARVAVVESRQGEVERRLERMESKIDILLQQGR